MVAVEARALFERRLIRRRVRFGELEAVDQLRGLLEGEVVRVTRHKRVVAIVIEEVVDHDLGRLQPHPALVVGDASLREQRAQWQLLRTRLGSTPALANAARATACAAARAADRDPVGDDLKAGWLRVARPVVAVREGFGGGAHRVIVPRPPCHVSGAEVRADSIDGADEVGDGADCGRCVGSVAAGVNEKKVEFREK